MCIEILRCIASQCRYLHAKHMDCRCNYLAQPSSFLNCTHETMVKAIPKRDVFFHIESDSCVHDPHYVCARSNVSHFTYDCGVSGLEERSCAMPPRSIYQAPKQPSQAVRVFVRKWGFPVSVEYFHWTDRYLTADSCTLRLNLLQAQRSCACPFILTKLNYVALFASFWARPSLRSSVTPVRRALRAMPSILTPLATLSQIDQTPSNEDGIPSNSEDELRTLGCQLIQQAGILLKQYCLFCVICLFS